MAHRVAIGEIALGHSFVDDRQVRGVVIFGFAPHAPLQQGNAQDGKIVGADEIDVNFLIVLPGGAEDFDALGIAIGGRRGVAGDGHHGYSRHGAGIVAQMLEVGGGSAQVL